MTYATFRTRDQAEAELEDMFADGAVSECENPRVVRRADGYWAIVLDI